MTSSFGLKLSGKKSNSCDLIFSPLLLCQKLCAETQYPSCYKHFSLLQRWKAQTSLSAGLHLVPAV